MSAPFCAVIRNFMASCASGEGPTTAIRALINSGAEQFGLQRAQVSNVSPGLTA
jgi:hypothetical protein